MADIWINSVTYDTNGTKKELYGPMLINIVNYNGCPAVRIHRKNKTHYGEILTIHLSTIKELTMCEDISKCRAVIKNGKVIDSRLLIEMEWRKI